MSRPKLTFFWPLRLIAVLSLVGPAFIFSYATWQDKRQIELQAHERLERALDVLQEQALKSLQTVERSISEINEVLRGMPDDQIRGDESDLYLRFKRTQQALPQIESIWAFDRDGHPLISSTIFPVPRELNNSDRSYFAAQRDGDAGTFIGEVVRARVGGLSFFVVSGRRAGAMEGDFNGVIGVTVMPDHFSEFYRKVSRGHDSFSLVRADGALLARFPEGQLEGRIASSDMMEALKREPEAGFYKASSPQDHIERQVGYRKVPGFPVYVAAGIETGALLTQWRDNALMRLAIGLPAVLALFFLSLYALRRAERFQEETWRREAAEAALKQAQRLEAIGQLTGGVAHDFNNLLMIVSGNASRLKRQFAPEDQRTRRAFEAIEVAVSRGSNLTRQLLSFSRRQTHEAKALDFKERLPLIQSMLQSSLRGDIVVTLKIAPDVWIAKLDDSEFELALLNLAVNARDAMSGGGELTIAARNVILAKPNAQNLSGAFVAVSLTDTGTGIHPDLLGRVFEPFFTTKDVGKGTGLGLSQVYGFAQQAGGGATVESEVGRGTTVTLYLPRHDGPAEPAPDEGQAAPMRAQARLRILLVEDNTDVAEVTRAYLDDAGYDVVLAVDVAAALDVLHDSRKSVDLMLSDVVMPGGLNGLDLARQVRRERGEGFPIVLATGYSDRAQAAADEGFIILRKPYGAADLAEAMAQALASRRESATA